MCPGTMDRGTLITSTTLLRGLADPRDQEAWERFVGRYRPLVVDYLERVGLAAHDAEDVAQASLLAFSEAYRRGRYDRDAGRLRSWLFGIVRRQLAEWWRGRLRQPLQGSGIRKQELLEASGASDELAELWDRRWREAVLRSCLDQVRREVEERTFRAFERFCLDEAPCEEVAGELGMTENAVYGAKRRVLGRVRALQPLMEDLY